MIDLHVVVECGDCHRTQLRRSKVDPDGLSLEELDAIGWVFDETVMTWRCPFCCGEFDGRHRGLSFKLTIGCQRRDRSATRQEALSSPRFGRQTTMCATLTAGGRWSARAAANVERYSKTYADLGADRDSRPFDRGRSGTRIRDPSLGNSITRADEGRF